MFQITPPLRLLEVGHCRRPTLPLIGFSPEICLPLARNAHSLFIFYRFHSPRRTWRCSINPPRSIHLLLGLAFAPVLSSFIRLPLAPLAPCLDYDAARIIANRGLNAAQRLLYKVCPCILTGLVGSLLRDFFQLWNR